MRSAVWEEQPRGRCAAARPAGNACSTSSPFFSSWIFKAESFCIVAYAISVKVARGAAGRLLREFLNRGQRAKVPQTNPKPCPDSACITCLTLMECELARAPFPALRPGPATPEMRKRTLGFLRRDENRNQQRQNNSQSKKIWAV